MNQIINESRKIIRFKNIKTIINNKIRINSGFFYVIMVLGDIMLKIGIFGLGAVGISIYKELEGYKELYALCDSACVCGIQYFHSDFYALFDFVLRAEP